MKKEEIKKLELTTSAIDEISYCIVLRLDDLARQNMENPLPKRTEAICKLKTLFDYLNS